MTEKLEKPMSRLLLAERETWSQVKHRLTEQVRPLFPHLLCLTFLMSTLTGLSMLSFFNYISFKMRTIVCFSINTPNENSVVIYTLV